MSASRRGARSTRRYLALLPAAALVTALVGAPSPASGANPAQSRQKLERLQKKIHTLNRRLQEKISRKQSLLAQLGQLEQHIGVLHHKLSALHAKEAQLRARREKLEETIQARRKEAENAKKALSGALRASFILGHQPRLKLALQGEDPARVARRLAYFGYYARARARRIDELAAAIAHYQALGKKLAQTQERLARTLAARQKSLARLAASKSRRAATLAQLKDAISGSKQRIAGLERDAERLENVIRSVHEDLDEVSFKSVPKAPFSALRGKLPWPVAGAIVDDFGSSRADHGALEWEAVRIAAPAGTPVHAIGYGRVVYTGWLPFYGLVVMIGHGNGYLVVYGHNRALFKKVGEKVAPGEVIAAVGRSGGQSQAMLYFQIRHHSQPLDPQRWCRGSPAPPR